MILSPKLTALYFRVSTERQTSENQFEDVLRAADIPAGSEIRGLLYHSIRTEKRPNGKVVYRLDPGFAARLAGHFVYVEHCSSRVAGSRPMFEQMKRDAGMGKFDRLIVWKVTRLGRNMREVISTVYELADLGITVVPVASPTGPITSMMGKLLWAIQAWYAEMENNEKVDAIKAGQARARKQGKHLGRPRHVFDREEIRRMRRQNMSWSQIAKETGISITSCRRAVAG